MYFVYIVQSDKDHKYYIGMSEDIERRIAQHNAGFTKSLKNRLPVRLVYKETYESKRDALIREREIKSYKGGNSFKKLINLARY